MKDDLVEDIPPDEIVEMTVTLDRAFRAVGCEPECHCCEKPILIGHKFKLALVVDPFYKQSTDQMLCYHCTPAKLLEAEKAVRFAYAQRQAGGFTRPHK